MNGFSAGVLLAQLTVLLPLQGPDDYIAREMHAALKTFERPCARCKHVGKRGHPDRTTQFAPYR